MTAIDVAPDPAFGYRAEEGIAPTAAAQADPSDVFGAAFRQSNSVMSAFHAMRNSGSFAPVPDYNPVGDIKGWKEPNYFLEHGEKFVGSQSPAETLSIKDQIDAETRDRKLLAANGKMGFVAQTVAGMLDPTMLLPGGVAIDAAKGGLTFTKAAVEMGKAGLLQTVAQEALLHASQQTRTYEESAINVASGTLLTALLGGAAVRLLSPAERVKIEAQLHADRAAVNEHAGNPGVGRPQPRPDFQDVDFHGQKVSDDIAGVGTVSATGNLYDYGPGAQMGTKTVTVGDHVVAQAHIILNDEHGISIQKIETLPQARRKGYAAQLVNDIFDEFPNTPISTSPRTTEGNAFFRSKFGVDGLNISKPGSAPTGTGYAIAAGAAASDTRKIELVPFGLSEIPGVRTVVEKTSPMQRVFGAESVTARRTGADLGETALLMKENLEGKVTTAGPAVDREARLFINQLQVAHTDEMSRLFSEYRYGEQKMAPRAQALFDGITGRGEPGKMSYQEFAQAVTDAGRNGDVHEIPQVQMAAQFVRNNVFEPWKKRAIDAGLLPEGVDVKTADSYMQRLYNKQAIAARRPEFVNRVTDWLAGDQAAKAQAQERIGLFHGALESHRATIEKLEGQIDRLSKDTDVIAARQEETTRFNKAANRRSEQLRESQYRNDGGIRVDVPGKGIEKARGGALFETLARERGNLLADRASAKLSEIEKLEGHLAEEIQNHDLMRDKIEKEIGAWDGKTTVEAKRALKARAEAVKAREAQKAAGTYKGKDERLTSADKAVDSAVADILKSPRDLERAELQGRADQITDRIIGSPDGRLPYDIGNGGPEIGFKGGGEPPRGPLAAREFNIPDATIRDFLENNIDHIVATHLRTIVPDVLLTEKFGDVRMTEAFRKINDEYAALSASAKSDKARTALETERQGVISDLADIRDRIRGVYGIAPEGPLRNIARTTAVIKNYNVLTSLGSAALSSLPDMAGTVMRHGLVNTFNDAWVPFFKMLTRQDDIWKEAGRQYRAMGIAVESVLAQRHHALTDTLDSYHPQNRLERTMQWATGKFQMVNLLGPWTDFAKINASLVAGSEILRAAKAAAGGTASARMLRTLGESGIEPHMAERIAKAFEKGGEVRDGVHLPNTADWTDKEARRVFEGAVARDADISVVTPGQEKPLWMSQQVVNAMGQFKSFTAAANERILIANLQRRDAQVLQGLIFSMGLGMLSYKIGSLTGGAPASDKPQDWIKEAISKGNLLGWFEEANAMASKATRGGLDIYRMIGADKPLSRFASRSAMDQLLGPTAGKIQGILSVASGASKPSEWSEADSKALRRLVAGQNVFYLRGLFNQVEAAGNNAFGIEMKVKPERH
jgi:ribosomal protein S18 acetylase RimI-like enzyme